MEFFMKLPRDKKECALFIAVIFVISVNIIAPLITFFEVGFHLYIWADTLRVILFIWLYPEAFEKFMKATGTETKKFIFETLRIRKEQAELERERMQSRPFLWTYLTETALNCPRSIIKPCCERMTV